MPAAATRPRTSSCTRCRWTRPRAGWRRRWPRAMPWTRSCGPACGCWTANRTAARPEQTGLPGVGGPAASAPGVLVGGAHQDVGQLRLEGGVARGGADLQPAVRPGLVQVPGVLDRADHVVAAMRDHPGDAL